MKNEPKSYRNELAAIPYLAVSLILAVLLLLHWLFLLDELGMMSLPMREWMIAILILYPFLWIVPLLYLLLVHHRTRCAVPIKTNRIVMLLAVPIMIVLLRVGLRAAGLPWWYLGLSVVYAVLQTICFLVHSIALYRALRSVFCS